MILLLSFAFLSGLVTILTPCIWPLLLIILSSSIGGRGHPEEADFNTAIILLGNKIPKGVRDDLQEDLRAVEEGRSSKNQ